MDTKGLEKSIKKIIKTGSGYGPAYLPVLRETKKVLKRINKGKPTAENFYLLGNLCLKLDDNLLALEAFQSGFRLNSNHVNCGTYSALILEQQEKWQEALVIYKQLNDIAPENILIVERMLMIFYLQNDLKQVLKICYYFLEKKLYYPSIFEYISKAFYDCGNINKAKEYMQSALSLDPENEHYKNLLVHHLYKSKDFQKVIEFSDYLQSNDNIPVEIRLLYANSLAELGEHSKSRNFFVYLLKKHHRFTVLAEIALYHLTYKMNYFKGKFINQYILNREPGNVLALTNLAFIDGQDSSLQYYEKVIAQYPDVTLFRLNYGHCLLEKGYLDKGFEYYESRIASSMPFLEGRLTYPQSIENTKLFIWNEQGLGDQFIWSWMFRYLTNKNVKAKIQVDERLLAIMTRSFPELEFTGEKVVDVFYNENFRNYDAEMALVSLGKYLTPEILEAQKQYELGNIIPAHLIADQQRVGFWKEQLELKTSKKCVGVCWRSGIQGDMRDMGHLTAEDICSIFVDLDCVLVNIQYDYTEEEVNLLSATLGERFLNFTTIDLRNDQDDLASLILALDLVFSVGTAVLALAGAVGAKTICPIRTEFLGKPYQIMLPSVKSISHSVNLQDDLDNHSTEIAAALLN